MRARPSSRSAPASRGPLALALALALALPFPSRAQAPAEATPSSAAPDSAFARLVRTYTTDARFLPVSVSTLPLSATVPSPQRYFGSISGAPGVMHHTDELYAYFRALAQASPRVRVETLGRSEEGREIVLVLIANEGDLARVAEYRQAMDRLADPRRTSEDQARQIASSSKPFYYLNGGLHSPEMGSPEMLMELAYRLAVSEEPAVRRIRDNVVVLINPVSEPDGRDKQVDWYFRYTKGRSQYDDGFPRTSPYWGRYIVHDNNRDGLQLSAALTHAIFKAYYDFHPVVMHDLHESVPLLYVSTGTGPYNENNDPIVVGEWQTMAHNDITSLEAQGLPGVWTWGFFDGWWPGYAMWVANNHNSVGRFFETFGNAGADTYVRDLSEQRFAGEAATARTWYRPWPPTSKVRWSARDNVNYMEAGVLSSLTFVADNRQRFLENFWRKGYNSWQRGLTQAPHAFVIPGFARQRDPKLLAYLVNQLERQHVEVRQATAPAAVTGAPTAAGAAGSAGAAGGAASAALVPPARSASSAARPDSGDFVVLLDQPYRDLAVNLLSVQKFPATAQYPPYDDIAWTLQHLYGVEVRAVDDTAALHWPGLRPLADTVAATSSPSGSGSVWLLPYRAQAEVLTGLYWLRRTAPSARVLQATSSFQAAGRDYPAGSLLLEGVPDDVATQLGARFALPLFAAAAAPRVQGHRVHLPRVAVYHTWTDTRDEGWVRYTFEQRGIPYTSIDKDDLRRGGLRGRFDVILLPNTGGSLEQLIHEVDTKWGPIAFQKSKATPNLGTPASSPDITGGPGFPGLAALQRFLDDGGVLLSMANATRLVADAGIARALEPHAAPTLFHPGSIVRAKARRPDHPLLYGYSDTPLIFRGNGPLYQVADRDSAMVVLQYGVKARPRPDSGDMLGMGPGAGGQDGGTAEQRDKAAASGYPSAPAPATAAAADTAGKAEVAPAPAVPLSRSGVAPAAGSAAGNAEAAPAPALPLSRSGVAPAAGSAAGKPEDAPYVVSGMVRNEGEIVGQGAIFDVPVGRGRVLAFTFNPLHRFLSQATFPLVWNALLSWDALPAAAPAAAPEATAARH